MKITDFIIIYLACGAPFGTFYFLQNRNSTSSHFVYFKSFCLIFVWIPYAVYLLHDFVTKSFVHHVEDHTVQRKLEIIRKKIEAFVFESDVKFSIFQMREVFERYAGLSLAQNFDDYYPSKTDEEIFRVALRQNIKLGASCLRRRNKSRIIFHQNLARLDFLQIVIELRNVTTDKQPLQNLLVQFAQTLNDPKTICEIKTIFLPDLQKTFPPAVQTMEDLWMSDSQQFLPRHKNAVPLQILPATRKD